MAPVAIESLRIISYGYVFYAWGMVMMQAFNGAGDTATPTWINFFCFWLFQIPLAWLLAMPLDIGPTGVFVAIALSYSLSAVRRHPPVPSRQVERKEGVNSVG